MTLAPGSRISSYEIVGTLGKGGMGEVYRARDTRLGRDVALKVLPELFASDPERLARFRREAHLLASLNHPNIASVFGLEDGVQAPALVMELIEGRTLADLIADRTRGMEIGDVTAIARQIVDGLEAAHEMGVIHRDLKPANIKVREDGTVKILDFGLAKAMVADGAGAMADPAMSPTLTARATQLGVILGTAAYMAPEQAKGRPVDKRADIWGFGVLLYEMLTGRRAFDGEDVSDTLAAVLTREPDLSALPAGTPPSIVSLMRRCLERDPKRRLRDIGEARLALEAPAVAVPAAVPDPAPLPARAVSTRSTAVWRLVAAALALALLGVSFAWWRSAGTTRDVPVRATVLLPKDVTFDLGLYTVVAISRDGSKMALVGSSGGIRRLYVRRIGEFEPRLLDGTDNASSPFFSPNGAWIGFFATGKLKKVSSDGGPVITLAEAVENRGGVWGDDDSIVFTPGPAMPVYRVPAAGGTATPISTIDEVRRERTHRWPTLLPDGKHVLVTVGSVEHPDDYDDATIQSIRLSDGERKVVVQRGRMSRYASTGHLLFLRGKVLYAVPFDPERLVAGTSPVPVIDGVSGDVTTGAANYSLADSGAIVFVPGDPTGGERRLAWVDRQGRPTPIDVAPALYSDPKVSPDGRRVAVMVIAGASTWNIHVVDTARGTISQLTFDGVSRSPVWSPDGRRLVYIAYDRTRNASTVMSRSADGTGNADALIEINGQAYVEDISRDGATILLSANPSTARTKFDVFSVPLQKGAKPTVVVSAAAGDAAQAVWSPDGKRIAYTSYETGQSEIYVQAYPTGGGRAKVSNAGGLEPRWALDGRALYYTQATSLMMMVPIEPGPAFAPGKPHELFSGLLPPNTDSGQTYAVGSGDRFLMLRAAREASGPPELRLILNWLNELRTLKIGK
jgi:serine/threonine-protein kinase